MNWNRRRAPTRRPGEQRGNREETISYASGRILMNNRSLAIRSCKKRQKACKKCQKKIVLRIRKALSFNCEGLKQESVLAIFASDLVVLILPLSAACANYSTWPRNARSARLAYAAVVSSPPVYERSEAPGSMRPVCWKGRFYVD